MLESAIEKPSVAYAKRLGVKVKKKVFGEHLDRWFFFQKGCLFIVEFKAPSKKLTPLQELEIDELQKLGYDVEVHDNVEEFKTAFDKRVEASKQGRKVVPAPVPERFRCVASKSRGGRAVRGSGNGQNLYHPSRFKHSKA